MSVPMLNTIRPSKPLYFLLPPTVVAQISNEGIVGLYSGRGCTGDSNGVRCHYGIKSHWSHHYDSENRVQERRLIIHQYPLSSEYG
jgi:hypothetical protein